MTRRVKLAVGLLIEGLLLSGIAQVAQAATVTEIRYACDEGQRLVVRESAGSASVQFIDRTYNLQREHSEIGRKYISQTAALIVDGTAAVFVAEDRLQLGQCSQASSLVSSK